MNDIIEKINRNIKTGDVIPKPRAKADYHFCGWCISNNENAIAYAIPNHKNPEKPHKKYIRESELKLAYSEFLSTGKITRKWFNNELPKLASQGACSFTTIGGILILLGEAKYDSSQYCQIAKITGIEIIERGITDLFTEKNNKSLGETLQSQKYQHLHARLSLEYSQYFDYPLGTFLKSMKESGNSIYKMFLNPYGDQVYCSFKIKDKTIEPKKGIYHFLLGGRVVYVGRCHDNFKTRFNSGYGKISPKNCFMDGQSTNCRINSLVNEFWKDIDVKFFPMTDDYEIDTSEKAQIREIKPIWNIQY